MILKRLFPRRYGLRQVSLVSDLVVRIQIACMTFCAVVKSSSSLDSTNSWINWMMIPVSGGKMKCVWWLSVLGTDPKHQRKGYGTFILHESLKKVLELPGTVIIQYS